MTYSCIEVKPVTGTIGAEVSGIDLSGILLNSAHKELHQAFLEYKVLFFRNQVLNSEQLINFSRNFGKPGIYPFLKHIEGYPEIIELLKTEDDTVNFGCYWHSDTTYLQTPFLGTVLYALEAPPIGGDTIFADMSAAYEALSDGMKALLRGLTAINSSAQLRYGGREQKWKR